MVNLGGDLRHMGQEGVTVEVTDPFRPAENCAPLARLRIRGQGVATSGGYRRRVFTGGKWRSHLIDPATGRSAEGIASATVVAPSAMEADAMATAFAVLPPEVSVEIMSSIPDAGCLLVLAEGRSVRAGIWEELER
jgi:thiamine biosynthesis lipoprotein